MSNHTDMQDKYCGHRYDIHPIHSLNKGNHERGGAAEGRVTSFMVAAAGEQGSLGGRQAPQLWGDFFSRRGDF